MTNHEDLIGLSDDELLKLAPDATHQHKKGDLYRFIGEATHTETGEKTVVYLHLFPHAKELWNRPSEMFFEDGRFRKIQVKCLDCVI